MRNKGSCGFLRKGLQFVESSIIARTEFYWAVALLAKTQLGSFAVDEYDAPCDLYKSYGVIHPHRLGYHYPEAYSKQAFPD